jgi:hypothetical protein
VKGKYLTWFPKIFENKMEACLLRNYKTLTLRTTFLNILLSKARRLRPKE